jgi:hypothetical protein
MSRIVLVSALALAACGDGRRDLPFDSGPGVRVDTGTTIQPDAASTNDCSEAARWVYVLDADRTLMQFRPDELAFRTIGTLTCPAPTTPFSMAVDRDGRAWVLYQNGNMFDVSTTDASCTATTFAPNQNGFELFGMGFASDAEGSEAETLYVAGGAMASIAMGSSMFGTIDEGTLVLSGLGSLPGWPELTGTGAAEVWGFFPDSDPPSVRQLDKANGASLRTIDISAVGSEAPAAWAFAFWGGRFYVFLQSAVDLSTNVWRVDPTDSSVTRVLENTGFRIVGAGVSTCAPTELI